MAEIPEPKTRLEQYWAGILDKIEGGGNPNYIETIEGTLANPWGSYSEKEIIELTNSNNATCYITISQYISGSLKCVFSRYNRKTHRLTFSSLYDMSALDSNTAVTGAVLNYRNFVFETSGAFSSLIAYYENEQMYKVPDATAPATLTIIHHPMPDSGT